MTTIGKLYISGQREYIGNIKTMNMSLEQFYLRPRDKTSPNAPDYDVIIKRGKDEAILIGAAWQKKIMRGEKTGRISLQCPLMIQAYFAVVFLLKLKNRRRIMVKKIPEDFHSVTPTLTLNGPARTIELYKKAFNAREEGKKKFGKQAA